MKRNKIILRLALILALFVFAIMAYAFFLSAYGYKPDPMPNPNGYEDLVKAGNMLVPNSPVSTTNVVELQGYIATNKGALKLARVGLSRDCRIPDDYSTNYISRYVYEGMSAKRLALAFADEATLARIENRTNDAVEAFLDAVALGIKSSHGAFMVAKLIGMACESIGRNGLRQFTNSLPADESRYICAKLESLDKIEDRPDQVLSQEDKWMMKCTTLREKVDFWRDFLPFNAERKKFIGKCENNTLERRQLMLAFAARAYTLEKGKPPANTAALVPDYLKQIPKDPTTGTNLTLHP